MSVEVLNSQTAQISLSVTSLVIVTTLLVESINNLYVVYTQTRQTRPVKHLIIVFKQISMVLRRQQNVRVAFYIYISWSEYARRRKGVQRQIAVI